MATYEQLPGTIDSVTLYTQTLEPDWYDPNFTFRRKIIVKKEAVQGNPQNIEVMFDLTDPDGILVNSVLYDSSYKEKLRITDQELNPLDFEATYTFQQDFGVKKVRVFFLAPSLSSSEDNVFYFYYKASSASTLSQNTGTEIWNKADTVFHYENNIKGYYSRRGSA